MSIAAHSAVEVPATPLNGSATKSTAMAAGSARPRVRAALLCGALVAMPFLAVRFPPITDLPQHAAQIRLFVAAIGDSHGAYRIQWSRRSGSSRRRCGSRRRRRG